MKSLIMCVFLAGCTAQNVDQWNSHARVQMQCDGSTKAPVIADCFCDQKDDKGFFGIFFNAVGNILGGAFF